MRLGAARSLGSLGPAASEPARPPPPPRPPRSIYGAALGPGIARRSRGGGGVVNLAPGGEVAGEGPEAGAPVLPTARACSSEPAELRRNAAPGPPRTPPGELVSSWQGVQVCLCKALQTD